VGTKQTRLQQRPLGSCSTNSNGGSKRWCVFARGLAAKGAWSWVATNWAVRARGRPTITVPHQRIQIFKNGYENGASDKADGARVRKCSSTGDVANEQWCKKRQGWPTRILVRSGHGASSSGAEQICSLVPGFT